MAAITEAADCFRTELKIPIPPNYPFVGSHFNVTRTGIHADGLSRRWAPGERTPGGPRFGPKGRIRSDSPRAAPLPPRFPDPRRDTLRRIVKGEHPEDPSGGAGA